MPDASSAPTVRQDSARFLSGPRRDRCEEALQSEKSFLEVFVADIGDTERNQDAQCRLKSDGSPVRAEPGCELELGPIRRQVIRDEVVIDIEAVAVGAEQHQPAASKE